MIIDINWFFKEIFPANSFDRIIINFPDPWPKNRHHKHRCINKKSLNIISDICRERAALEFVTDHWGYLEETLYLLEEHSEWQNPNGRGIVLEDAGERPISFFEEALRKEGKKIYYLYFIKQNMIENFNQE